MGWLEQNSRKRAKRKNLQRIILETVTLTGVVTVGMLAPNVIGAMSKLGLIPVRRQKEYVASSASKMTRRGLLKFNGRFYELTDFGRKKLQRWQFVNFSLLRPKKWDQKWRMIIFDIPEKKKRTRNYLTLLFKKVGLVRLQDSVWIYPYDCEDIIALLKSDFGIGKYLLYVIVEELENDKHLREEFGLC